MTPTGREGEKQSAAANQWLCCGDLGDFGLSNEVTVDRSQTCLASAETCSGMRRFKHRTHAYEERDALYSAT